MVSFRKNTNVLFGEEAPFFLQFLSFSAEVQLFSAQLNICLPKYERQTVEIK